MPANPAPRAAILALTVLAACGDGGLSLDPFGWFSRPETAAGLTPVALPDERETRPFIPVLTGLRPERVPGGVIVTATGLPPTTGWHDAALVADGPPVGGSLVLSFRARPPAVAQPVATPYAREITVGTYLSDRLLREVRSVTVRAASGSRSIRF